jgi:hypothetical protein
MEVLIDRRSARGLSGWIAYSLARTRQFDVLAGPSYWADSDQRHTLNLSGVYHLSSIARVGATFRAGSNVPIPGYFIRRQGRLFAGNARNEVRLPPYARLDVRADRQLRGFGRNITLFVEVLNLLNRANAGVAAGTIDAETGEAKGFSDTLLRRRASAGFMIQF